MKAIKAVEINNFQSHANTHLEFAPAGHLTVITGDSDSGKTAILRALRMVCYNEPTGTDFIRVGTRTVEVTATMADGYKVTRKRTPSLNQYIAENPGGHKETYEGFGLNVPVEVQAILGVSPAKIVPGEMELKLNIAEQLEGPFLGSKTMPGSYRAKVLGKLAGTEDVDTANKTLGTDIYRHDRDMEKVKTDIETKVDRIAALDWVDGLGVKIAQLEVLVQTIKSSREQLKDLKTLKDKLDVVVSRIEFGKGYLAKYRDVEHAAEKLNTATVKHLTLDNYNSAKSRIGKLEIDVNRSKLELEKYVDLEKLEGILATTAPFDKVAESLRQVKAKYEPLGESIANVKAKLGKLSDASVAQGKIDEAQNLSETLGEFRSISVKLRLLNNDVTNAQKDISYTFEGAALAHELILKAEKSLPKLIAVRKAKLQLTNINDTRKTAEEGLGRAKTNADTFTKEYKETLFQMGICPTCGADTCKHNLEEVI